MDSGEIEQNHLFLQVMDFKYFKKSDLNFGPNWREKFSSLLLKGARESYRQTQMQKLHK